MSNVSSILVAGATGAVGSRVAAWVSGRSLRTLSRHVRQGDHVVADATDPRACVGVCDGIDTVFSALGASVGLNSSESRSYHAVDTAANRNLIAEARRAGVRRFVYVSLHVSDGYAHTRYALAHEEVVATLRESGLSYTVIRPTGIFTALDDLVEMARRGMGVVIGSGAARANPVHPDDVARVCIENLVAGPSGVSVGGPEILTRRQIVETAFEALGRDPRIIRVPAVVLRFAGRALGFTNPRKSELLEFAAAVSSVDSIAPLVGRGRLVDYFRELSTPATVA